MKRLSLFHRITRHALIDMRVPPINKFKTAKLAELLVYTGLGMFPPKPTIQIPQVPHINPSYITPLISSLIFVCIIIIPHMYHMYQSIPSLPNVVVKNVVVSPLISSRAKNVKKYFCSVVLMKQVYTTTASTFVVCSGEASCVAVPRPIESPAGVTPIPPTQ